MPTVIELGQSVKRKYPGQYDDMSDVDLGRKVRAKYPEYNDYTDAAEQPANNSPKPGIFSRFISAIGEGENQRAESERAVGGAVSELAGQQWKEGTAQVGAGVEQIGTAAKKLAPFIGSKKPTAEQAEAGKKALFNEIPGGASKVIRGGFQAASPALVPAIPFALAAGGPMVAAEMGLGYAASQAMEHGGKAVGLPEGAAELAGDVAGMFGYGKAAKRLFTKAGEPRAANGQVADALIEALRSKAANGKQNEAGYRTLLEELRSIEPERAKEFDFAPTASENSPPVLETLPEAPPQTVPPKQVSPELKASTEPPPVAKVPSENSPVGQPIEPVVKESLPPQPVEPTVAEPATVDTVEQDAARILQAVRDLEPNSGVPVSNRRLREALPDIPKERFDKAALRLREKEEAFLSTDADPHNRTPEERAMDIHSPEEEAAREAAVKARSAAASSTEPINPLDDPIHKPGGYYTAVSVRENPERGSFSNRPIPQEDLKPDDFLNFKRIRLSSGEETALRKDLQGMIEAGQITKDVEPHANILAAAADIGPEALKNVMAHGPGEGIGGRAAVLAMRNRQAGITRELVAAQRTLALEADKARLNEPGAMTEQQLITLEGDVNRLRNDEKQYLQWIAGQRTEAGRSLAALRLEANATVDWPYWQARARQAMGLPPTAQLPDHITDNIRGLVVAAQQAADERAGALARGKLAKAVADLEETGWIETATTLWKAGLLTGAQTHGVNLMGNMAYQTMLETAKIPTAIVDALMSVRTGTRTASASNFGAIVASGKAAATKGLTDAKEILQHGISANQLAQGDFVREINFQKLNHLADTVKDPGLQKLLRNTNDVINWYGRIPFRLLSASDAVFKAGAAKSSIIDQATVKATNELKSGAISKAQFDTRRQDLINAPTEEMKANAMLYANYATFNDENAVAAFVTGGENAAAGRAQKQLSKAVGSQQKWVTPTVKAAGSAVLPFRNTPANIFAKVLIDFNPSVGAGAGIYGAVQAFRGKLNPFMQQRVAELMGRGSIGLGLLLAGYFMNKRGIATGTTRGDKPGQENVKRAAGEQRGSVRIGDRWFKTVALQPAGNLLAIGAAMAEAGSKDLKDEAKRPLQYVKVGAETMLDQPMLQGVNEVVETLKSPSDKRMQKALSDKAGSLVPAFVSRNIAPVVNPEIPDTQPPSGAGLLGTAAYGIQSRLPGARNQLPPTRDIFGRKPESTRGQALFPIRSTKDRTQSDPLDKLAVENKLSIQIEPRILPESDEDFAKRSEDPNTPRRDRESDEEYAARKAAIGQLIASEIMKAEAAGMPEDKEERRKAFQAIIRNVKRDVNTFARTDPEYLALPPAGRAQWLASLPASNQ